jgi:hypothetical protein
MRQLTIRQPQGCAEFSLGTVCTGSTGKDARYLNQLRRVSSKTADEHRKLVMHMAQKMARR